MDRLNATLFGTGPKKEKEDAKGDRKHDRKHDKKQVNLDFFLEEIEHSTKKMMYGKDPHTCLEQNVQYIRQRKRFISNNQYEIVCRQDEPAPNNLYVALRHGNNYKLYKLYGKNNYIKLGTAKSTFVVDPTFRVHYIFPKHLLREKCTIIQKRDVTNQLLKACEQALMLKCRRKQG